VRKAQPYTMKTTLNHSRRSYSNLLRALLTWFFLSGCPAVEPPSPGDISNGVDVIQADCVGDSCSESPCAGGCAIGVCHPDLKICVACLDDTDCGGSKCHPVSKACVQCYEDSHCPGGTCTEELICVECTTDSDCGEKATCNTDTFTCEGECTDDTTCDDNNVCTTDACNEGTCAFVHVADGALCEDDNKCTIDDSCLQGTCLPGEENPECCEDKICSTFQKGKDTTGDGCIDTCYCPDEQLPAECPKGSVGVDQDGDGCFESCECTDANCVSCADDKDCNDGANPCSSGYCVVGACEIVTKEKCCVEACDCYQLAKVSIACDVKTDIPHWECQSNTCFQTCGELPDDVKECVCKELTCTDGQTPTDIDNDGCDDTCVCGTLTCDPGLVPKDTDKDGCEDACVCAEIKCKDGLKGIDTTDNGCPDTCVCPGGALPTEDGCLVCKDTCDCYETSLKTPKTCDKADGELYWSCEQNQCTTQCGEIPKEAKLCLPCAEKLSCEPGTLGIDTQGDGCIDTCMCPDGNTVQPGSACVCVQANACDPSTKPIDSDLDGCVDWCQCGSGALIGPGEVCPCLSPITCGANEKAVDVDNDGCTDACTCDGPGCACALTDDCKTDDNCLKWTCYLGHCASVYVCCVPLEDCPKGAAQKDTTGDGCPDTCECDEGLKPGADSCNCAVAIFCLDGFAAVDTNDNGCPDTCAESCQTTCDCYGDEKGQDQSCVFLGPKNTTQGTHWTCSDGLCQEKCGDYTAEHYKCMGCKDPIPSCPNGASPIDTTGDSCPDSCSNTCEDSCDCYAKEVPDAGACDADNCADCKSAWTCDQGSCVSACLPEESIELCLDSNVVCMDNADCPTNEHFCLKVVVGQCKETGQCSLMPDNCDDAVKSSVCGCDNKTYSSACDAYSAGTSVQGKKACK
jgi:hypothetical protein